MASRTVLFQMKDLSTSESRISEFSINWEFNHVTSLPYYLKSDGKAKASVKVVKQLFKKACRVCKDPLLDYRNTHTEGVGAQPEQLETRVAKSLHSGDHSFKFPTSWSD